MIKFTDSFIILDQENTISLQEKSEKKVVLLVPAKKLYIKNFVFPKKARNKIEELVKTKFIKRLAVPEKEIYYSYFVDKLKEDKINVICFAVNKSFLKEKYELFTNKGIKIKAIFPIPLLYFLNYRKLLKESGENSSNERERAYIYIDELGGSLYFSVFYSGGIFLHSCNSTDYLNELIKIKEYINEHLKIFEIIVFSKEKRLETDDIITDEPKYRKEDIVRDTKFEDLFKNINKRAKNRLNLLKFLAAERKKQENKYKRIIAVIVFLVILSTFMSIYNYFQYKYELIEKEGKELIELQPAIESVNLLQQEIIIANDQLQTYKNILQSRQTYLPWIYEINKGLALDVEVNNLIFKDNSMVLLEGSADSASKIMENLQESDLFNNLEFIGGISIEKGRERFKIAGDLLYE